MSASLLLLGLLSAATPTADAQAMGFEAYLSQVGSANLELAANRLNVPIAAAQIALARVFPEPVLSLGVPSVDISSNGSPISYEVGLSQTIEIGGKRGSRVEVAEAGTSQAKSDLDDLRRLSRNGKPLRVSDERSRSRFFLVNVSQA